MLNPNWTEITISAICNCEAKRPIEHGKAMTISTTYKNADLVSSFNQLAYDILDILKRFVLARNDPSTERFVGYINGKKNKIEASLKVNAFIPINAFTEKALRYLIEIYSEDEDRFMNMEVYDSDDSSVDHSDYKKLWLTLSNDEKQQLVSKIKLATFFSHAFFLARIKNELCNK